MSKPDWDKYAELGLLQAVIDPNDSQGFKNRLIDQIQWNVLKVKLASIQHLLDFGCGTGRFAPRIESHTGAKYTGIDTSANMIRVAKAIHKTENFNFAHFNGFDIPFPDNSFDGCVTCGVLQYVIKGENSQQVLAEIKRVLAPGGRLVMLEQVSRSNQTSGLGMRVLTEDDYVEEIAKQFEVRSITRIRSCNFSKTANRLLYIARFAPWLFDYLLNYLAISETQRIQKYSDSKLSMIRYYDVLIEALVT